MMDVKSLPKCSPTQITHLFCVVWLYGRKIDLLVAGYMPQRVCRGNTDMKRKFEVNKTVSY